MAKDYRISVLLGFYGDVLTDKPRDMIEFYYDDDLSLAEIAQNEGITRQGVRDNIKRGEAVLLDMEERLGLVKRFEDMKKDLESIRRAAYEIEDLNNRCGGPRDIRDRTRLIAALAERLCED